MTGDEARPLQRLVALAIVGLVVFAPLTAPVGVIGIAGAANNGVHYVTDSGFEIVDQSGGNAPRSGNPFTDSDTLELPDITLSASGDATVTIDQRIGTDTKLSNVDDSPSVTVNPSDKQTVVLNGGFDSIDFSAVNYDSSNSDTDLTYTAGTEASIEFKSSGLSSGETVTAVEVDTGTTLDSTTVDSDKSVSFTALDSGTYDVNIKTESSGGGGGGGGGSSSTSSDESDEDDGENTIETAVTVNRGETNQTAAGDSATDMNINVSNPQPGQTLVINETNATIYDENETAAGNETVQNETDGDEPDNETSGSNVRTNQVTVEINTDRDFTLSVTTYEEDLNRSSAISTGSQTGAMKPLASGTPMVTFAKATGPITQPTVPEEVSAAAASFENQTNTIPAGYVQVNTTLAPEEISNATLAFSIRQSYLEDLDVDAENVTLYHQINRSNWETRDTEYKGSGDTYHRFEGNVTEFSVFALGTGASQTTVVNASIDEPDPVATEPISITATVENRGRTERNTSIDLHVDGTIVDSRNITLEGGETSSVNVSFTPESAGKYTLSVGSFELERVEVQESPDTGPVLTTTDSEPETEPSPTPTTSRDETTSQPTTTERDEPGVPWLPIGMGLFLLLLIGLLLSRDWDSDEEGEMKSSDQGTTGTVGDGDAEGRPDS